MINPKVFIIILHYKNWKDTNECLASLKNLNYDNFKTIVIDNDKENRGFAGGNNLGIKQALEKGADYVLLLNNDTVVEPNFLKELVEAGESDKKAGILGPIGGKINWLYTKGVHVTKNNKYISGACMLVKREVIEKIGLMDEEYFLYCEDVDWCLKARKAGYKCVVVLEAKIWHKVSSSAKAESFSYIYYHTRNGLLLAKKNAPFFIKILAYLWSFWIFVKQIIKLVIFPEKKKWAKAIRLGIGDFYKRKFGKYENWH
jgi:GT2 family glycosyltransferase